MSATAPAPKRTGMSDTHLRADLRQQNPLYMRAGNITARFEMQRCAYHARALADEHKSEAQRRREAMVRREKFVVLPNNYEVFEEGRPVSRKKKQDRPSYELKPPLRLRLTGPAPGFTMWTFTNADGSRQTQRIEHTTFEKVISRKSRQDFSSASFQASDEDLAARQERKNNFINERMSEQRTRKRGRDRER